MRASGALIYGIQPSIDFQHSLFLGQFLFERLLGFFFPDDLLQLGIDFQL